jgi:hypothetical protein
MTEDLQEAIDTMVETSTEKPHEAVKDVSPYDVHAGRRGEVLE